jgi:hypothetical protein
VHSTPSQGSVFTFTHATNDELGFALRAETVTKISSVPVLSGSTTESPTTRDQISRSAFIRTRHVEVRKSADRFE